jgi:phage/plasmid primase-like uncharacterized protein
VTYAKEVKQQAKGCWNTISASLAPQLAQAIEKAGKHVPCPVHGGQDGFRLFNDFKSTGGGICNTCGEFTDGFSLIQWVNGWNFYETLKGIHEFLNGQTLQSVQSEKKKTGIAQLKNNRNQQKNHRGFTGLPTNELACRSVFKNSRACSIGRSCSS